MKTPFLKNDSTQLVKVVAAIALLSLTLFPFDFPHALYTTVGIFLVLYAFLVRRHSIKAPIQIIAFAGGTNIYWGAATYFFIWPLHFIIPLLLALLITFSKNFTNTFQKVFYKGRVGSIEYIWIFVFAVISSLSLIAWLKLEKPDLSQIQGLIPDVSPIILIFAGAVFALVNAILEEAIWRCLILNWLRTQMRVQFAVVLQAISFGISHWNGLPSGMFGIILATIYGLMLGYLAVRSKGILAPILTHIITDVCVFTILVFW